MKRRELLGAAAAGALATQMPVAAASAAPKVYFTDELSPQALQKMVDLVRGNLSGRVAIKLHTGEPDGPNIIPAAWVKPIQRSIPNSTIVECNVLYGSPRRTTEGHRRVLKQNGWTFCEVDIMDADGDMVLPPIKDAKWLKEGFKVGKTFADYDSMLVLTHFKGHTMGGFGGALKNISIGCGTGEVGGGKDQLHHISKNHGAWRGGPDFMERMAEAGKAIVDHFGNKIVFVNVMRRMSVDCDCAGTSAAEPTAPDIGILASSDLLAIDKACLDLVYGLPEKDKRDLVERIESRSGLHQITWMQHLGMGDGRYEFIKVS